MHPYMHAFRQIYNVRQATKHSDIHISYPLLLQSIATAIPPVIRAAIPTDRYTNTNSDMLRDTQPGNNYIHAYTRVSHSYINAANHTCMYTHRHPSRHTCMHADRSICRAAYRDTCIPVAAHAYIQQCRPSAKRPHTDQSAGRPAGRPAD